MFAACGRNGCRLRLPDASDSAGRNEPICFTLRLSCGERRRRLTLAMLPRRRQGLRGWRVRNFWSLLATPKPFCCLRHFCRNSWTAPAPSPPSSHSWAQCSWSWNASLSGSTAGWACMRAGCLPSQVASVGSTGCVRRSWPVQRRSC